MHALLVAAAFTIAPAKSVSYASASSAAAYLETRVQTGTLLVSKGDCLAVKVFTRSPYTHVATVVKENGKVYVYESANGYGVIRETLAEYLDSESPTKIYVLNPKQPFSKKCAKTYRKYLKSQLGKPYAIKHHITGERCNGLHCSEYVTDGLMKIDLIHANQPSRVSPGSLAQGVVQGGVYESAVAVTLKDPQTERQIGKNHCHQMWLDTKICTIRFCLKLRRLFACR